MAKYQYVYVGKHPTRVLLDPREKKVDVNPWDIVEAHTAPSSLFQKLGDVAEYENTVKSLQLSKKIEEDKSDKQIKAIQEKAKEDIKAVKSHLATYVATIDAQIKENKEVIDLAKGKGEDLKVAKKKSK